jgi:hypothetical protein
MESGWVGEDLTDLDRDSGKKKTSRSTSAHKAPKRSGQCFHRNHKVRSPGAGCGRAGASSGHQGWLFCPRRVLAILVPGLSIERAMTLDIRGAIGVVFMRLTSAGATKRRSDKAPERSCLG